MSKKEISLPYILPSRGYLYQNKIPDGQVTILPLRGEQEELFGGSGAANHMVLLQHLVGQLVQYPQPSFSYLDLLVTDWFALLVNIFAFSYSPDVSLKPTCPACKKESIFTKKTTELECTMASIEQKNKMLEPFIAEPLPLSKDKIQFKLLRLRDIQRIDEYRSQLKSIELKNPVETYALAQQIVAINEKTDFSDLERMTWIRETIGMDLRNLRQQIQKKETGYDLKPQYICPFCSTKFIVELPLDFFRSFNS